MTDDVPPRVGAGLERFDELARLATDAGFRDVAVRHEKGGQLLTGLA
jgi:hypothetical protein